MSGSVECSFAGEADIHTNVTISDFHQLDFSIHMTSLSQKENNFALLGFFSRLYPDECCVLHFYNLLIKLCRYRMPSGIL